MSDSVNEDVFEREQIEAVLAAFENRNAEAASKFWAEDGVFIDPHYPEQQYRGPEEIRAGLEWALENIVEQPGLTIRNFWSNDDRFAIEVDTHHTMQDGTDAEFLQAFVVESTDGQIARWQSYLPFPPPDEE